jgi:hypothetical protein
LLRRGHLYFPDRAKSKRGWITRKHCWTSKKK